MASDAGAAATLALARPAGQWRTRVAVALLVAGLYVAVFPGLAAGRDFLPRKWTEVASGLRTTPAAAGSTPVAGGSAGRAHRVGPDLVWSQKRWTSMARRMGAPATSQITYVWTSVWKPCGWSTLPDLVQHHTGWACAVATLTLTPLLFVWWRRTATPLARAGGIACGAAAGAAVCAIVLLPPERDSIVSGGAWPFVPLGGALMCAAFIVAPAPDRRGDE